MGGKVAVGQATTLYRLKARAGSMPAGRAPRAGSTKAVDPVQSTHRAFFNLQRELFLDEARKLARLDGVDAVARVIHYFAENDTAYFVMPHVPGTSIAARVTRPSGNSSLITTLRCSTRSQPR